MGCSFSRPSLNNNIAFSRNEKRPFGQAFLFPNGRFAYQITNYKLPTAATPAVRKIISAVVVSPIIPPVATTTAATATAIATTAAIFTRAGFIYP